VIERNLVLLFADREFSFYDTERFFPRKSLVAIFS